MTTLFAEASAGSLAILGGIAVFMTGVVGAISNAILRDTGFGMVGNGVLIALGAGGGAWTGLSYFGKI